MLGHRKGFTPLEIKISNGANKRFLTGFTLIELLVVIAIIALLMSILMPALSKARKQAQNVVCKNNLKSYAMGTHMYCDDYDDMFLTPENVYFSSELPYPPEQGLSNYSFNRWCNDDVNLKKHPEYGGRFFRYIRNAEAFICPTFRTLAKRGADYSWAMQVKNFNPWFNYTMNGLLGRRLMGSEEYHSSVGVLSQVKRPAETFCFTEESPFFDSEYSDGGLDNSALDTGSDSYIENWLKFMHSPRKVIPGPHGVGPFWNIIGGFHNAPRSDRLAGEGNCAFLDGHVAGRSRLETFYLAWPRK
jgi:prepilin-type N-terminal cleavage/methylation domain-containing protein/prepilin-type processing-associated H-X9-DG protein